MRALVATLATMSLWAAASIGKITTSINNNKTKEQHMRRKLAIFSVTMSVVLAGILGCKSDSASSYGTSNPPPNTHPNTVVMGSMSFNPSSMTVTRGTTVTWRNDDGGAHTSTSDSTSWDTGNMPSGTTRTTTFNTVGTFKYHCTYHRSMGMVGTIIVQ